MASSCAAVTYAEQLVTRGLGLPLWHPEPREETFGEVEIGDVGFVSEGRFIRLFNALRREDDPVNADGVPVGFVMLEPNTKLLQSVRQHLSPGPICTTSTTYKQVTVEASTSIVPGIGASYTFRCTKNRGAVALLGDYGHQQWYLSNRQFRDYIAKHHASWCAFADEKGYIVAPDALILVSGWLKTSEWALATFSGYGRAQDLSLSASAGSYATAIFQVAAGEDVEMNVEQRAGPPRKPGSVERNTISDQCMFLRYYRLKSRALGRPKVLLQADAKDVQGPWDDMPPSPPRHPRSDSGSSSNSQSMLTPIRSWFSRFAMRISAVTTLRRGRSLHSSVSSGMSNRFQVEELPQSGAMSACRDPLDDVLDYILQHDSSADAAVACFEDIYEIFPTNTWPESLSQQLALKSPRVRLEGDNIGHIAPHEPAAPPAQDLPESEWWPKFENDVAELSDSELSYTAVRAPFALVAHSSSGKSSASSGTQDSGYASGRSSAREAWQARRRALASPEGDVALGKARREATRAAVGVPSGWALES